MRASVVCALRMCAAVLLLAALPGTAFGQAALSNRQCRPPAKQMARLELIFGAGRGATRHAFMAFLAKEVTPRFPDGLSLFSGYGQWRNGKGRVVQETSRMLLIWYVPDSQSETRIEAIRNAYEKRFHQQSVLRADGLSCVSF